MECKTRGDAAIAKTHIKSGAWVIILNSVRDLPTFACMWESVVYGGTKWYKVGERNWTFRNDDAW